MIFQVSESACNKVLAMVIFTFIIPIIPVIYFIIKKTLKKLSFLMMLIGAITFIFFALVFEKIVHLIVLSLFPLFQRSIWGFGFYGAFMAGLFEETGRLIIFKLILAKFKDFTIDNLNSIYYGIGHGGIEVYLIVTLSNLNYYFYCKSAISGKLDENIKNMKQEEINSLLLLFKAINKITNLEVFYVVYERINAVTFHICASVIVWIGVMKNKIFLYFIAFFLHFLIDFFICFGKEFQYYPNNNTLLYILLSNGTLFTLILSIIFWMKYIDGNTALIKKKHFIR